MAESNTGFTINDTPPIGYCDTCKHYNRANKTDRTCTAFPDGIPLEIWLGKNPHTAAYPGDNGILYQEMSAEDWQQVLEG